jgi:DNA-binding response OmpR family regulator
MPRPRTLSVLIVEDYPDAADTLAVLVELHGHHARVARTGEEAVRLAREFAPDVVLLDIGLPDADGYAVAERLCGVLERRPLLVVVTGFTNTQGRSRVAGIDYHFLKPADPCVLERLLSQHAETMAAGVNGAGAPGWSDCRLVVMSGKAAAAG